MWFRSLFKDFKSRRLRKQAPPSTLNRVRRGARRPLKLEALEDRRLLAFVPEVSYPVGAYPAAIVSADFNGDGRLDLATANSGSDTVSVLLGNGDATLQAPQNSGAGTGPQSLVAGNLNGDGRIDLVTVNVWDAYASSGDLSVLLGNGDGAFQPPQAVVLPAQFPPDYTGSDPVAQTPRSAALGDLNADGNLDLVALGLTRFFTVIGYDGDTGEPILEQHDDEYVNVLLGNGDGTFGPGSAYHVSGQLPYGLALGDFNGDGRTDVVTSEGGYLSVLLGNGDGSLQTAQQSYVAAWLIDISNPVQDFNRDGKLDLLMRDGSGGRLVLMRGNGDGTFQRTADVDVGASIHAAVVGDVNADGKLDIVVMSSATEYGSCDDYGCYDPVSTRSARVLLGYGDGSFAPAAVSDLGTLAGESVFTSAVLVDFDADGFPDLAASDYYQGAVAVARNDGIWTFLAPPPPSISISDVTIVEGNSGTLVASFTVTLSAAYGQPVTVAYATADGAATAGSDYQAVSGTLTILAGETVGMITVPVNGDRLAEANETFVVNLSNSTNATIADGQGLGTILDDEPRISISDVTKSEGKKGQTILFTFSVTLSAAYDEPVTMSYSTVDGTAKTGDKDYKARTGTLTFAPGETTKTITIEVIGDSKKEGDETFYLDLFGNSGNSLFTKNRGIGTILNDD